MINKKSCNFCDKWRIDSILKSFHQIPLTGDSNRVRVYSQVKILPQINLFNRLIIQVNNCDESQKSNTLYAFFKIRKL